MNAKIFILFLYLFLGFGLILLSDIEVLVKLSFFINFGILGVLFYYHIFLESEFSPFISAYIVFFFLFLFVAPIIQISGFSDFGQRFATLFPHIPERTIFTNALVTIFHLVFLVFYLFFKSSRRINKPKHEVYLKNIPIHLGVLMLFCFFIFILKFNFVISEIARPSWMPFKESISSFLINRKVLFMVPLSGVILSVYYLRKSPSKKSSNYLVVIGFMIVFLLFLFWFKNPLTEKRNALGPIYILLIFLFAPRILNSNTRMTYFLFFSLVIVFPLVSILTHTDATFKELISNPKLLMNESKGGGVLTTFSSLNYDAFGNIGATIDYVDVNGLQNGKQILSTLFFFVPRSIWPDKAIPTGQLIGDHLIEVYRFNFNNLSNPIISEGYLDFGIVGVIIFAIFLALAIVFFLGWLSSTDPLKKMIAFYFAMHLIFLLRGDLTNGYAYFIGTFIGVFIVPKILFFISNQSYLVIKNW